MNNIKSLVKKKGFRLNWVAKKLGVSDTDMSNYIAEQRTPNTERVNKLASLLDCSVKDLYPNAKKVETWKLF